jgi:hypothetical protein
MKKGRFTEEQIIGVLKQHEAGRKSTGLGAGDRGERSDDLHVEVQVRRDGLQRRAEAERAGG